jgi:hypothetical protein
LEHKELTRGLDFDIAQGKVISNGFAAGSDGQPLAGNDVVEADDKGVTTRREIE